MRTGQVDVKQHDAGRRSTSGMRYAHDWDEFTHERSDIMLGIHALSSYTVKYNKNLCYSLLLFCFASTPFTDPHTDPSPVPFFLRPHSGTRSFPLPIPTGTNSHTDFARSPFLPSPPPFSPPIRQIEVGPCICRHPGPGYRERHLSRPKPPQTLPRSCNQPLRFPLPATLPSTSAPHPRRSSQTCSSQTMRPSPLTRCGGGSGRPGPIFSGFDRLEWACPRLVLEFGRGFGGA
ncbi:hypothetical protein BS50DRAFT_90494 [Corynespora cassiicola Philippines]|uniref:Uncharacterized protein n=1 Tax=Corynespora cassiicola Philippines TaxID=1448308 RepID=A0A2T2NEI0_CORCC|nr:hypothetical protein BS50DRAFT_90494 [Corynespora cassiicola Philippines]